MAEASRDLDAVQQRIASLYSASAFRSAGTSWVETLVDHFRRLQAREHRVLNWCDPAENVAEAASSLDSSTDAKSLEDDWLPRFAELLRKMLARGQNLHHPRYLGHQVPASIPIAALFDAIGSATNQVMAIYEMGPWSTAVERAMIAQLGAEIGYEAGSFGGLITHGGSLANLTALLTARNIALPTAWRGGIAPGAALVVQADVHYCVVRAAGILGLGTDQVIRIPVDHNRKMRVDVLDEQLAQLRRSGRTVIAVAAGACATPIGAFDPLDAIADVCGRHQVWLHVDAAHGGAAVMSARHRGLLAGLSRADSVVWDAHKMMFMPALCAFAFYKNRSHRFAAFEQDAPYLFDPTDPGVADYDSGTQTLECTKRAAAFGLWGTWSLFGRQLFADLVDVTFELTRQFHEKLCAATDFQPLHVPECNIQVFRYLPAYSQGWSPEEIGQFQLRLRREVITSGEAYIVPIVLDGYGALRVTLINPCTTSDDMDAVLTVIRECGRRVAG